MQANFLEAIGINKWGAMSLEPILLTCGFLLNRKITKTHRVIIILFMIVLYIVSSLIMVNMYSLKLTSARINDAPPAGAGGFFKASCNKPA